MKFRELFLKYKSLIIITVLIIAVLFTLQIINTYSNTVTSGEWDGKIALSFTSGTGTEANPYVITSASEYAYFKKIMESEDAAVYANKNYHIVGTFNYGGYDININNTVPFSGTIDGEGNTIFNAAVNNALFNKIDGATIKNIKYANINVTFDKNTGVISTNSNESNIESVIIDGKIISSEENLEYALSGISYDDSNSKISNVVINLNNPDNVNYYSAFGNNLNTEINNLLVRENYNFNINNELPDNVYIFSIENENIVVNNDELNKFKTNKYSIVLNNNNFIFNVEIDNTNPKKEPRLSNISIHDSGVEGTTVYINDLESDLNYYEGMDYTYFVDSGTIPNFTKLNKFGENNLVKVYIKYSGTDIAGNNTGYVSNDELYSDYIYYKYYPLENGYVTIPLIDNPYARRPNDMVFHGWITDYENAELSIDMDTYVRYVKIPVSDVNATINITMYAIWDVGSIYEMTSNRTISGTEGAFETGMVPISTTKTIKNYGDIEDFSAYYIQRHIDRWDYYPSGSYDEYLEAYSTYSYCRTRRGCDYYISADSEYDENETYYILNSRTGASLLPYTNEVVNLYQNGIGGYYKGVNVNRNASQEGLYNDEGIIQHGNCTSYYGCNLYELIQYYDDNGNVNMPSSSNNYYYLTTRDTNILVLRATASRESSRNNYHRNTVPMTITSLNNGSDYRNEGRLPINNAYINPRADLRIEYVDLYSTGLADASDNASATSSLSNNNVFGNYYNLKIGRGIEGRTESGFFSDTDYLSASGVYAGNISEVDSLNRYTLIVETGKYNILGATGAAVSSDYDLYLNGVATWGNDLDRVQTNNDNLDVYFSTAGNWGGNLRSTNSNDIGVTQIIKSGKFGSSKNSYSCGVYAGGRGTQGTQHYVARSAIVEGGEIFNLIGGPFTASSRTNVNDSYIYVKGGTIDLIIGGAGLSTTYGNRIISVTGGKVNYGVLGGSNGSSSTGAENQSGEVFGSTFVYVGGKAHIGGGTENDLYGVEPGGVFGAGNGVAGLAQVGSVNNSNILINGGSIEGNVYGGGNYGANGYALTSGSTSTTIKILSGEISGSVYGGGNNNGSGKELINSDITIDVSGGTVNNSVYGGSRTKGKIYGSTDVTINGGTIKDSVYGGGEGGYIDADNFGTYVEKSVNVTVNNGNINNSVYGGSAYGTVNALDETTDSSQYSTNVVINNGIITNSVFGGGKGGTEDDINYTPKVVGNITVTTNGGDMTNVFGGNDQAGNHDKQNDVNLNGGIIENAFGGGNKSSVTNTNVLLNGATVTNIYGGSNTLGDVSNANVNIASGTVQNVYGGNNEGGSCNITNVTVEGNATVNGSVYGGGNEVDTTNTTINLISANGRIPNIYGGGNNASVNDSKILVNGVNTTNIFGGSNSSGTVLKTTITYNSGDSTNVYGGNNDGGNTVDANIIVNNGTISNIYGGGNKANGSSSNITVNNGTITNLFGGGNSAGLNESNIHVLNGNLTNVYGASNNTGLVNNTNILIENTSNTVSAIYGGGNKAVAGDTSVTIENGKFTDIFGGGNLAASSSTNLDINGGTFSKNIYGGGNYGIVNGDSTVTITNASVIGSVYAGGNGGTATVEGNTSITIDGNTIIGTETSIVPREGSVFGGGNKAATGTSDNSITSNVKIAGGTIYGNVYGGANTSVINGSTFVNIGNGALTGSDIIKSNIFIKGHIFGGGEANESGSEIYDWFYESVTEGTNIVIDGQDYDDLTIGGSFYGGGNASTAKGDTYLLIKNYGSKGNPKENVSIQRVTYVTIDNSSILLKGAIDRANDYDKELFSISRVINFKIKNNSELYFETGTNLLEEFESLDSNDNIATVTINEDNNTLTRNVDNRVYVFEGKNINIAHDQQVTDYGEVHGMTFLGIFNYDNNHKINTGIYNSSYNPGDTLPWSGTFSYGSYVLGKHVSNHNIKVDGFYSNFINEETTVNEVKYIVPTPDASKFYMWFIGENVIEYNVNLEASKYSTMGSVETSFLEFSKPNTSFQILSFDSSDIAEGISLVDKNEIPRISLSEDDANNIFGLSLESSNSGWLTNGKTSFYTREPSIKGETYYEGENSTTVPTLLFYLYHSKNISVQKELGTVRISVMAITKINALSNEVKRLVINVNMSTALYQTNQYEGAMTPGDKYELFTSTANNITTKSKFSAYYSLYGANKNLYEPGYHRVLTSSFVLPVGTKITMIDFGEDTPKYYYHVIDNTDYENALTEFAKDNECAYKLSIFTEMGSKSNNSNYNDAAKNSIYYNGTDSNEEFIFIVDFSDANIEETKLNNKLLIEIRNDQEGEEITVLGVQRSQLVYNLYANMDSQIDLNATPSQNPLYIGYDDIFDITVNYQNSILDGATITDTQYFDYKLGVQIYLKNNNGDVISGTDLTGTYFTVDGVKYYPDIEGYTHIKLANKVGNMKKWIIFNTDNSTLASGDYTFVIEAFASPDGIYYSTGVPVEKTIPITIISSNYGLDPTIDDESVILDASNPEDLKFNIKYTSLLNNPNIKVAMYRRKYDEVYDTSYELVDLQNYVSQSLFATTTQKEYLIIENPNENNEFVLSMNDNLQTGTYRLAFRLYDNDVMIGEIIRYIIIK